MKKLMMSTALAGSLAAAPAFADPTIMVGLSFTFGGSQSGQLGISGRILSNNQRDAFVGAIGGTYYPGTQAFGLDAGIGYNINNTPITLTYDFVNQSPMFGLGWADLEDGSTDAGSGP
jgi:hypothetical protein